MTALALGLASPAAAAGSLQARVMVLPSEGTAPTDARLAADLVDAVMRGARRATPNVARATATLGDTAVIVGCDPAERACVDAVAAALNVDQMLLIRITTDGADAVVEVTAVSREAPPVARRFRVRPASRKQDLAAIEAAVPSMLDAEARGGTPGGGDGQPGGGDGQPGGGDGQPGGGDGQPGGGDGQPGGGDGQPGGGAGPAPGRDRSAGGFAAAAPKIITIGGGVLLLGGVAFWGLAAATQGEIDDAPTASEADLARLRDLEDQGRSRASIGNGLVLAGGITAAAGAIWWWRTRGGDDQPAAAPGVVVTPVVGPALGGFVVEGRW